MYCFVPLFVLVLSLAETESVDQNLIPLGCFIVPSNTNPSNHILNIEVVNDGTSAVSCMISCKEKQHRYAGIVAGSKCLCGDTFRGQSSDNCTVGCVPDSSNLCGGQQAVSVYESGDDVPGMPLDLRILESTSSGLHLTWSPPISSFGRPVQQYQVTVTPLVTLSGLEPPGLRSWVFGGETKSAWLYGVHPATHYTVEVRANNTAGLGEPANTDGWTSIAPPLVPTQPELLSRTPTTITVKLHTVSPANGPITSYRIVVVDETVGAIMNPSALSNYYNASKQGLPYYIAAEFDRDDFVTVFTVGDGQIYGGYFNAPLEENVDFHVLLGAVSHMNKTLVSYSPSDHGQHTSSVLHGDDHISKHEFPNQVFQSKSEHPDDHAVSDHSSGHQHHPTNQEPSALVVALSASVGVLGCLVLIAVVVYIGLRVYLQAPRRPDHQELTVNSYDNGEIPSDGLAHYLPDEDLPDHYSRLKQRVAVMAPADLTIVGEVGQGAFGAVRKGMVRSGRQVHSGNHSESPALVHHILDSSLEPGDKAVMLRSLGQHVGVGQHKHVVALMGLVEEVAAVSLVFEYHTQTFKQLLTDARAVTHYPVYAEKHRRFSTITEHQVLSILCGVARGLQWLRCCGVSHGAICARNVVLVDGSLPKLTGFGLLTYTNDLHVPDYRRWVARELLAHYSASQAGQPQQNGNSVSSNRDSRGAVSSLQGDVWGFGVLLWEAVTLGGTPYPELRGDEITHKVQTGLRPPQPQYVGDDLYQVMLDCWQLDPGERPEFPQIEASLNQLAGEGSHLLFATYAAFQYHLYAPHLEFKD